MDHRFLTGWSTHRADAWFTGPAKCVPGGSYLRVASDKHHPASSLAIATLATRRYSNWVPISRCLTCSDYRNMLQDNGISILLDTDKLSAHKTERIREMRCTIG